MNSKEIYSNIQKNSVNTKTIEVTRKKKNIKKALITLCLMSLATGFLASMSTNKLVEISDVNHAIMPYNELVSKHTHRTENNENVWYNGHEIGKELLNDGKVEDEEIFGVYKAMEFNSKENMDKVVEGAQINSNFENYLRDLGFVKDGKIDYNKYEELMTERLISKSKLDSIKEDSDGYGM